MTHRRCCRRTSPPAARMKVRPFTLAVQKTFCAARALCRAFAIPRLTTSGDIAFHSASSHSVLAHRASCHTERRATQSVLHLPACSYNMLLLIAW